MRRACDQCDRDGACAGFAATVGSRLVGFVDVCEDCLLEAIDRLRAEKRDVARPSHEPNQKEGENGTQKGDGEKEA